jgi:hypothetical protein
MNAQLAEAVAILERRQAPSDRAERFVVGFSFDPRNRGSGLVVRASEAPSLEHGIRARLTLRGPLGLAFGIDVAIESATGEWSNEISLIHIPHKDPKHCSPLRDCEPHLLLPAATLLSIVSVDDNGTPVTTRQCTLPLPFLRNINERIRRAQATSYRQWAVDQSVAMLRTRRDSPHEIETAVVNLLDLE